MPESEENELYAVLYKDHEGDEQITPAMSKERAEERARSMQASGVGALGVVTEAYGREHLGPHFVRYLDEGEQRATYVMPSYKEASAMADAIEKESPAHTDIQILPGRLYPSVRTEPPDSLLAPEPTEEQLTAFEEELTHDIAAAKASTGVGNAWEDQRMRHQALDWALRLAEVKRGGVLPKDIKAAEVVMDANTFLNFLKSTPEEK